MVTPCDDRLMVWPGGKGSIAITVADVECLEPNQFLNDIIINFYLKYLTLVGSISFLFFYQKCLNVEFQSVTLTYSGKIQRRETGSNTRV